MIAAAFVKRGKKKHYDTIWYPARRGREQRAAAGKTPFYPVFF